MQVIENGDVVYEATADDDGVITVPSAELVDAITRRLQIELLIYNAQIGGFIRFLPDSESESFPLSQIINEDGTFTNNTAYRRTEFVDIEYVTEFVYSGFRENEDKPRVYAYDENKQPVKILVYGGQPETNIHIIPDGTFRYVVACSKVQNTRQLTLYFG